jgi:hypothetical protein
MIFAVKDIRRRHSSSQGYAATRGFGETSRGDKITEIEGKSN